MWTKRHLAPIFAAALLGVAACTPTVDMRGRVPSPEMLSQIKVGETTEEQAQLLLGSPSTTMNWGGQVWHYVYERTETRSFLDPVVKEYKVVTIVFDDQGKVARIDKLGNKSLKPVDIVTRETPTAGKEMTIVEQMLGNVGKFAKEKDSK